jgi:hypothetical protein
MFCAPLPPPKTSSHHPLPAKHLYEWNWFADFVGGVQDFFIAEFEYFSGF